MPTSALTVLRLTITRDCTLSCVRLFAIRWTVARQAPLSMESSRPEYWSGLPCPPPGDLPAQGSDLHLLRCQEGSLLLAPPGKPSWNVYISKWASLVAQL